MSVTREEVAKIASLARIKMGEDELERMVPELNGILAWVEQLGEVDCSGPVSNFVSTVCRQAVHE